jgi:hypothetical protein
VKISDPIRMQCLNLKNELCTKEEVMLFRFLRFFLRSLRCDFRINTTHRQKMDLAVLNFVDTLDNNEKKIELFSTLANPFRRSWTFLTINSTNCTSKIVCMLAKVYRLRDTEKSTFDKLTRFLTRDKEFPCPFASLLAGALFGALHGGEVKADFNPEVKRCLQTFAITSVALDTLGTELNLDAHEARNLDGLLANQCNPHWVAANLLLKPLSAKSAAESAADLSHTSHPRTDAEDHEQVSASILSKSRWNGEKLALIEKAAKQGKGLLDVTDVSEETKSELLESVRNIPDDNLMYGMYLML